MQGVSLVDIEQLQKRIKRGKYLVKSHAVQHALKEGFERKHMVDAIVNGQIIEEYALEKRSLVCAEVTIADNLKIYLHIVCEYADPIYLEIVTAYIPDKRLWEVPPLRRRKAKR